MSTLRRPRGQSLVEFAVTLPAALLLVLLIVRMMIILNVWYTITQTTNIAIRAAALTGEASQACRIVMENLRNYAPDHLTVTISFADKKAVCQFVVLQSPLNIDPEIFITVTPDLPKFQPPITPSATPYTPTPGQTLIPTNTANPAGADTTQLPDLPVRIQIEYDMQVAGPFAPDWRVHLAAAARARLESRVKVLPTATPEIF